MIEQGHDAKCVNVFGVNKSCIDLVKKGYSTNQQIHVRYFFIKDRVDSQEIQLHHLPTKSIIADIFTKPLQGELFRSLRKLILNLDND